MKTVLVTGARTGLGFAICKLLSSQGFRVVAAVRRELEQNHKLFALKNTSIEVFDLAEVDGIHKWVSGLSKRYGRIYGLVNNAAIGNDGVLATMHESDIAALIAVNLHSPIVLTKYVSRSMLLAGEGRVVNVSSIIANTGFNGLSVYGATKAGLHGFSKSLSRELGKANITVNCVAPGYMETDMTAGIDKGKLESIKRRSPSGKLATVDAVADAVAYLLSPAAAMINGTTITVDAGSTA